jgi:hypothetical protein
MTKKVKVRWSVLCQLKRQPAATFGLATMLFSFGLFAQEPRSTATIRGRIVLQENGSVLPGASMTAYYLDPDKPDQPQAVARAFTDSTGVYVLTALKAGQYLLCPEMIGSDLVNPCRWGMPAERVTVRAGETLEGVDRGIERGRIIEVDVSDPSGHLDQKEVRRGGVHLLVGAWGPDRVFRRAQVTKKTNKDRTYSLVIPFDTPVGLDVKGRRLDLDDDKGKAKKDTDAPEMLTETKNASRAAKKVVVKVKGVKP